MSRRRSNEDDSFRGSKSVVKALQLLSSLRTGEELTLDQLTKRVELNKSTVYRLLKTLVELNFLAKDEVRGTYRLGIVIFELGQRAAEQMDLRREARPILERLSQMTRETVHLAILDDGHVICVEKIDSPEPVRLISRVGLRGQTAHASATGKALIANLDESQLDVILGRGLPKRTDRTITDPDELRRQLRDVRLRGYSFEDGESQDGVRCVGAPVWDHQGKVVAAISVAGPSSRIAPDRVPGLGDQVIAAANELSSALGYSRSAVAPAGAQ